MEAIPSVEELNHEEAKQYIGGVVFVTIIMTIGIIGNLHVLYIYAFRMKPSNHRIFILTLAVLDMLTCIIGMPFIIVDLRNPLTFTMISACKILRFVNYFICCSSALILTVIATDRYRKICIPLKKQISKGFAKILILICLGVSMILSWPAPVLYGHSVVNTTHPNVTGVRCYTEDRFKDTKYQAYFNAVLVLVVIVVFVILVVLYSFIGKTISKHTSFKSASSPYIKATESKSKDTETSDTNSYDKNLNSQDGKQMAIFTSHQKTEEPSGESTVSASVDAGAKDVKKKQTDEKSNKFDRAKRTTIMFFAITVFFFLSYFPHLILKILSFVIVDFLENMSFAGKVLYNTFVWCFFMNNVANCFVYGFFDRRFRVEVKKIYVNLFRMYPCRKR